MKLASLLTKLSARHPEIQQDLQEVLAHLTRQGGASHALKFIKQALRKERALRKGHIYDAIVYKDWASWERNHSAMVGITDLIELNDAVRHANALSVVDVYVYEAIEDDWEDDLIRGDLLDTVTVEIPSTASGKLTKVRPAVYRAG